MTDSEHRPSTTSRKYSVSEQISALGIRLGRALSRESQSTAESSRTAVEREGTGRDGQDPAPKDRSVSRGREFHSSGRGGAGNIRFSGSVPSPIIDGPDDFSVTRGREPRPPSVQTNSVSIGRGGAGNIRSPSRHLEANPAESAAIKDHEKGLIRNADDVRAANFQSSGRGGVGNMTRSSSHSQSRSRSRGPNVPAKQLSAPRSLEAHSKASLEEDGRVLYDLHENA